MILIGKWHKLFLSWQEHYSWVPRIKAFSSSYYIPCCPFLEIVVGTGDGVWSWASALKGKLITVIKLWDFRRGSCIVLFTWLTPRNVSFLVFSFCIPSLKTRLKGACSLYSSRNAVSLCGYALAKSLENTVRSWGLRCFRVQSPVWLALSVARHSFWV